MSDVPSEKGFTTGLAAIDRVNQRLVGEAELATRVGVAKIAFQFAALPGFHIHLCVEKGGDATAADLGSIERDIGGMAQLSRIRVVVRIDNHADADADGGGNHCAVPL